MDPTALKAVPASYWLGAAGTLSVSLIVGAASGLLRKRSGMKTRETAESGWLRVLPDHSRREWFLAGLFLLCTSGLPLVALAAHIYTEHEWAGGGQALLVLSLGIALAEVAWTARSIIAFKTVGDADVRITLAPITRDTDFSLRIDIPARTSAQSEIIARIVCIEHAVVHFGRFTHVNHTTVREIPLTLAATSRESGRCLAVTQLRIPSENCPPSGRGKSFNHTYEWLLRVELEKSARSVFPLDVI